MSHEIYKDRFVGITHAWHTLGHLIRKGMTAQQVMEEAGQSNWDIKSVPLNTLNPNLDDKGMRVIVRNLGDGKMELLSETLVEAAYAPISNEELFGPMIDLMVGQSLPVDAAGVLGKLGNRAFITFDAGMVEMPGGESYHKFLAAIANHTGRDADRLLATNVRVVCANTERLAISSAGSNQIVIPHNRVALDRFYAQADINRQALGLVHNYNRRLEQVAEALQAIPFSDRQWKLVADRWIEAKNEPDTDRKKTIREGQRAKLGDAWGMESMRAERMGQGFQSVWTAFQAASTYTQHLSYGGDKQRANRSVNIAMGAPVRMLEELNDLVAGVSSGSTNYQQMLDRVVAVGIR